MNAFEVTRQLEAIRHRTRRGMIISIGVHAIGLLLLIMFQKVAEETPGITEITWIDPVEAAAADMPKAVSRSSPSPVEKKSPQRLKRTSDRKFARQKPEADLEPNPQDLLAVDDRLQSRLASLQKRQLSEPKKSVSVDAPSPLGRPTLAGLSASETRPERPQELSRGEPTAPKPIALSRTATPRVQRAAISTNPVTDSQVERAKPTLEDTRIRRELAGARMAGPVADRNIISYVTPDYPDWAKQEAVEGSVTIYFVVLPDGRVKENVMVQKTSGFSDFDGNAVDALLAWRFEPLKGGGGEQWGTIMFQYRLSE